MPRTKSKLSRITKHAKRMRIIRSQEYESDREARLAACRERQRICRLRGAKISARRKSRLSFYKSFSTESPSGNNVTHALLRESESFTDIETSLNFERVRTARNLSQETPEEHKARFTADCNAHKLSQEAETVNDRGTHSQRAQNLQSTKLETEASLTADGVLQNNARIKENEDEHQQRLVTAIENYKHTLSEEKYLLARKIEIHEESADQRHSLPMPVGTSTKFLKMDSVSENTDQSRSTFSESSRTGSNLGDNELKRKEEDLTKDNAASPIDLECDIQAQRINKILNEAITKTKLVLCLPTLVQEYKTLNATLSPQHMDDLIFIFEQYENPMFSVSFLNMDAIEDIKSGDISLKNRFNPELAHLLYIVNSYPSLRPKIDLMVEEMRAAYDTDMNASPHPILEYLSALEHFRELMFNQMTMTAAEELACKIHTRKIEANNAKLLDKIKEYTACLKEEQEQFQEAMTSKTQIISKLENELSILNVDANIKLKKKILDSERQMVLTTRSHAVKYEMLMEEEAECKENYGNVLKNHIEEERIQRARRRKVESQLQAWLQKYDAEMTDKQEDLDIRTKQYEDEVEKIRLLEIQLSKQDKEYVPLMAEREEEYQQEMLEKMTKFLREHAARVIQNAWREVLANRAEKKKLKKVIKKQEDATSAAAAAAAACWLKPIAV